MREISDQRNPKRVSPYCTTVKNKIIYTKRYLLVVLILFVLIPMLYLIPCSTTQVKLKINGNTTVESFSIRSYSYSESTYHTINTTNWYIENIELYCSSFVSSLNNTEMMQWIAFGHQKTEGNLYRINTLKIPIFTPTEADRYQIGYTFGYSNINGYIMYYDVPVDYVLSYLKIRLVSNNGDENFAIDFYAFFQEESRSDLKLQVISEVKITALTFNSNGFDQYLAWGNTGNEIPDIYPYQISLEVRRYNGLSTLFGVYSI